MASWQAREAQVIRATAAQAWAAHRHGCVTCERAARSRRPREMCPEGRQLNRGYAQADADYRKEKAADSAPNPAQAGLWPVK